LLGGFLRIGLLRHGQARTPPRQIQLVQQVAQRARVCLSIEKRSMLPLR
jgi:hypothetical protein